MGRFAIIKGLPEAQGGACSTSERGGVLAYVMTRVDCGVNSLSDCGQKDPRYGRHIINICEFYWNPVINSNVRIGTIVHESSHHFGTKDEGYCDQVNCLALSSLEARNNADTYTKLVQELVADRQLPESPGGSSGSSQTNLCPQNSVTQNPDQDGDCICGNGYGCSQSGRQLDCPVKRDRSGREWFSATCSSCKCYPVRQRPVFPW